MKINATKALVPKTAAVTARAALTLAALLAVVLLGYWAGALDHFGQPRALLACAAELTATATPRSVTRAVGDLCLASL